MITNKELIEKLQKLPQDAQVVYPYLNPNGETINMDPEPSYNEFSKLIWL